MSTNEMAGVTQSTSAKMIYHAMSTRRKPCTMTWVNVHIRQSPARVWCILKNSHKWQNFSSIQPCLKINIAQLSPTNFPREDCCLYPTNKTSWTQTNCKNKRATDRIAIWYWVWTRPWAVHLVYRITSGSIRLKIIMSNNKSGLRPQMPQANLIDQLYK